MPACGLDRRTCGLGGPGLLLCGAGPGADAADPPVGATALLPLKRSSPAARRARPVQDVVARVAIAKSWRAVLSC